MYRCLTSSTNLISFVSMDVGRIFSRRGTIVDICRSTQKDFSRGGVVKFQFTHLKLIGNVELQNPGCFRRPCLQIAFAKL